MTETKTTETPVTDTTHDRFVQLFNDALEEANEVLLDLGRFKDNAIANGIDYRTNAAMREYFVQLRQFRIELPNRLRRAAREQS